MTRPEITAKLSLLLEKHLNPHSDPRIYMAKEVTFDYYGAHPIRVDYMRFKPVNNTARGIERGDFFCYEIKSSVADFRSKHGHNFLGDFNYYVMPAEVFEAIRDEIPKHVGVLTPTEERWGNYLKPVKRARRQARDRPVHEMLMMMFRSANRDRRWGRE